MKIKERRHRDYEGKLIPFEYPGSKMLRGREVVLLGTGFKSRKAILEKAKKDDEFYGYDKGLMTERYETKSGKIRYRAWGVAHY